jgi:hypothetical protein
MQANGDRTMEQQPPIVEADSAEGLHNGDASRASSKDLGKKAAKKKRKSPSSLPKKSRTRSARPYPASSFTEALPLGTAIHQFAAGQKVRRITLLQQMQKSPTSSATQMLITNSGKYGITTGGYSAEWIELTQTGATASMPGHLTVEKLSAQFQLSIERIVPFSILYNEYKSKRLPRQDVMKDVLADNKIAADTLQECVDTFIVNAKDLGLIQTLAGAETLFPIEHKIEELSNSDTNGNLGAEIEPPSLMGPDRQLRASGEKTDWSKICFIITPIGEENSEQRKHADLFLNSLIEPALKEFGLRVVRADKIGSPGMITSQVLEHVLRARLAIVDLSFHNPNAFYEMALRHASGLPVVQITRKIDKPPFDVNQIRTATIDTSDIYTLVPGLETYRSEIANLVRAALADGTTGNPITVFFPGFKMTIPPAK